MNKIRRITAVASNRTPHNNEQDSTNYGGRKRPHSTRIGSKCSTAFVQIFKMALDLHAPSHRFTETGTYIVTAATHNKQLLFAGDEALEMLESTILSTCEELGWLPQQWAVFPNHYHLVAHSPESSGETSSLTRKIHGRSAIELNRLHNQAGRKVWYQRWDTQITNERAYLARLNYVRCNAVHHGLVRAPEDYRWCSASWFKAQSDRVFFENVCAFPIDKVQIADDFF